MSADRKILTNIIKHAQSDEDDPLTPLIDDYLLKRENPKYAHLRIHEFVVQTLDRPRPPGRISPSQAGGCARQAAFVFIGAKGKKRIDPDQEMIFEDGKWRHYKWGYIFLEMERFFPKRFKVVSIEESISIDGLYIAGSLDAIVQIKVNTKWRTYVVDFKGANSYAYEEAFRTRKPNPRYVLQLITYMKAKGKKRGILLFESKDKNRYYAFPVRASDAKWAEVRLWGRTVMEHVERKRLPPKDPDCRNGTFLYNRCPFRIYCFGKLTDRQVELEVFLDFPGVKKQWKEGQKIVEEYETLQTR